MEPGVAYTRLEKDGADRLSIGGALSANAHGRSLTLQPMVGDVESFELIDATHGVGFGFTGASVGWSGQGTFTLQVPTDNFNGLLNNAGNPWGGMLLVFSNNNPGNGPIQGTLARAIYKLEFGPCPIGDLTGDLSVNVEDLLAVIAAWGPCPAEPTPCPADIVDDQIVNVADLLAVISHWHTWCPDCK